MKRCTEKTCSFPNTCKRNDKCMTREIKYAERMREINNYMANRRNSIVLRIIYLMYKKVMILTKNV